MITSLLRDLKALGPALPVRAVYEASKRLGGHALTFGRLQDSRRIPPTPLRSPFPEPVDISEEVRVRTLKEATDIVNGTIRLFGTQVHIGDEVDWHSVVHREGSWPVDRWWRLDISGPGRSGDVKWVWEMNRHRHLVILARASYLEPSEDRYLSTLEHHLETWIEQNPPEVGVNWYSNLEIALRAIAWLQIQGLVGERLSAGLRSEISRVLYHSGRHLALEVPHTALTMRNNHLLGDSLGLVALGKAFHPDARATRWLKLGDRLMKQHVRAAFREDGTCNEDSISYHRFVVEMLAVRVILGDPPEIVRQTLPAACQFMARLGVLEGPVPNYGDSDDGRVVVSTEDNPLEGTVNLGLALAGSGASEEDRRVFDELAWYAGPGRPVDPEPAEREGRDVGGQIGRIESGPFTVWLKAGSGPSHGHADLLSTSILWNGQWIVGDPGTGAYNDSLEQRNFLRSSEAHSVLRIEGEDQREPHRTFHWVYAPTGRLGPPASIDDVTVMWGVHDAYARLDPPRRIARAVVVSSRVVLVADWIEGAAVSSESTIVLHPDVELQGRRLSLWNSTELALDLAESPDRPESSQPLRNGWWSDSYGSRTHTKQLVLGGLVQRAVLWYLSLPTVGPPTVSDDQVMAEGVAFGVSWAASGPELWVEGLSREECRVAL